jgi:hypothetical protein
VSHYVYRFFNDEDEIIYVGLTSGGIKNRMYGHFNNGHLPSECYNAVRKIEYCKFNTKVEIEIVEKYLINIYKPIYNTRDKEFKEIALELNISNFIWKELKFKTKAELSEEKTQSVNGMLREQNSKLSKTNERLRKEIMDKDENINNLKKSLELKLNIPELKKNEEINIKPKYKFDSDTVEAILQCNQFSHVSFVGKIKINSHLLERAIIKNEGGIIIYYFEKAKLKLTKDSLSYRTGMKNFSEKNTIAMINGYGFDPNINDNELIESMINYYEKDRRLVV